MGTWRLVRLDGFVPGTVDVPVEDAIDRSCFGLTSLSDHLRLPTDAPLPVLDSIGRRSIGRSVDGESV